MIPVVNMVYNPAISELYIPLRHSNGTALMVYTPAFSGFHTPDTGIFSSPKVLVVASDPTNQPTEYSCFHDDHASPQALIPVIPSVLVFFGGESGSRTHGCFHIAGFQDRCLQPLGHLSVYPPQGVPTAGYCFYSAPPSVVAVGSTPEADAGTATLPPTKPASRLRRSIPRPFSIPLET